ncbi:hypothetical protein ACA910_012769 [Epithemia clementina (nom. ined.)]
MEPVLPISKGIGKVVDDVGNNDKTESGDYSESQQQQSDAGGALVRRHHYHYQDRPMPSPPASSPRNSVVIAGHVSKTHHLLVGLTVAGVASTLLTTVFNLFHVEVFLNAYQLPLSSYSRGSFIFSIINTVNDLIGAWIVDQSSASTIDRSDMVGLAGCVFSLCFLTPFFRWKSLPHQLSEELQLAPRWQDTCHFVMTMSLYDTLHSFTAILMGSIITDDHTMTEKKRVQFMASGKILNLVASFTVARIGLSIFDVNDLFDFRIFVAVIASAATCLFVTAQVLMHGMPSFLETNPFFNFVGLGEAYSNNRRPRARSISQQLHSVSDGSTNKQRHEEDRDNHQVRKLKWRTVALDFWNHENFHRWIAMEMLLESQVTFSAFFLKTFVDGLVVVEGGLTRETCDWFIAMVRPLKQIATIFAYVPIRQFGYPRIYFALFLANFVLAALMLSFSSAQSPLTILIFLAVYSVISGAVQSSGFHLAMADMVLEMKRIHAMEGRMVEPSLAGLFMGINALFCKPAESVLPVIAATVMERSSSQELSLFYLLVGPPLVCSVLQLIAWHSFSLTPTKTESMRLEMISLNQPESGAF